MKTFSTMLALADLTLALTMTACGGGGGSADEAGDGHASSGGEVPAEYQGAIAATDVAAGAEVYDQLCASCHPDGGPELEGIAWSAAAMRQQVREGEDSMPAFGADRVSAEELENVLAHLQSIGAVTE
ncbi:MAG: cytochrome c [Deltaproteobacteria bacterium]|nr:cytochrome c [Deltaproteobacteria bacterium]